MGGAVAAALLLVNRRLGLLACLAAALMALTRVYTAAHYRWDVLAGLAFGASVALLGWLLLRCPLTALTSWLRRQRGLSGFFAERRRSVTVSVPAGDAGSPS